MLYAVIKFNWKDYVLPAEDAVKLYSILEKAERYEKRYPKEKGDPTTHVWTDGGEGLSSLDLIPEQVYLASKLAGEPAPRS